MKKVYSKVHKSINHLEILHDIFINKKNFSKANISDHNLYKFNYNQLSSILDQYKEFREQLYGEKGRQMILADIIEYIFLGRGYYFASLRRKSKYHIGEFIKIILYFVNLLMCYESITVNKDLRKKSLRELSNRIPEIREEKLISSLIEHKGDIGLPQAKLKNVTPKLNKYFDTFLPKTAGGLWHELLVYVFLLRYNFGYVIPLLLIQKILSGLDKPLVPPDFFLLTKDKRLYGIEVGIKKEIQSGSFSIETGIPTATIDTINSRSSDRCPVCKKWILFCKQIIDDYSNQTKKIVTPEIKCLKECRKYSEKEILDGICPYTKYSRKEAKTLKYTQHKYADGLHYHYKCVLGKLDKNKADLLKKAKDTSALKTHFPYYQGLESFLK